MTWLADQSARVALLGDRRYTDSGPLSLISLHMELQHD